MTYIPTFFRRYKNWYNLFVKMASFLCTLCPVLGQNCNLVLIFSTHLPFVGYIFSCERKKIKAKTKPFQELAFGSSSFSPLNKH